MEDMNKLTVLLVDDHEGFINAAMRHFRKVDWLDVIGSAANGLEAIERSESLRPKVVLMDLAMPEMGGLQATRLIKSQDDAPYIVIASHFDDAEHREHALRAGADNFVSKLSYIQEVMPILEGLKGNGSWANHASWYWTTTPSAPSAPSPCWSSWTSTRAGWPMPTISTSPATARTTGWPRSSAGWTAPNAAMRCLRGWARVRCRRR